MMNSPIHAPWPRKQIGGLLVTVVDYRGKTPPKSPRGIPTLTAANIKGGRIDLSKTTFVSRETYEKWITRGLPQPGDVLVTTEAPVGEVASLPDNQTYLITRRCIGRCFLLRPDESLTNAFLYCLALAVNRHGVAVHALCAMSNHYHLIITDTEGVLPDFMAWFNRQLAMCVKRMRRWDEVVWEPNVAYSAVELTGPSEMLDKIAYVLLNPVSAALVHSPGRWPGALSTVEILRRGSLSAERPPVWFKTSSPERVSLELTAPRQFSNGPTYLEALDALLANRLRRLRAEFKRKGRGYLGIARVRRTRVTDRPTKKKQRFGRNPVFSALSRAAWRAAAKRLRAFRLAYRLAYSAWRNGETDVEFPAGTWWVVRCAGASAAT